MQERDRDDRYEGEWDREGRRSGMDRWRGRSAESDWRERERRGAEPDWQRERERGREHEWDRDREREREQSQREYREPWQRASQQQSRQPWERQGESGWGAYGQGSSSQGQWSSGYGSQSSWSPYGPQSVGWEGSQGSQRYEQSGMQGPHYGRGPKGYTRSKERILDDVNQALHDDPWLDASEVEVACENSEVVLRGTVASRQDKRRAEECAERISGVKDVRNEIRVRAEQAQGQLGQQSQQSGGLSKTPGGSGRSASPNPT